MRGRLLLAAALAAASGCKRSPRAVMDPQWREKPGVYAVIKTPKGEIVGRLHADKTPKTVDNFVGLADGTKEYLDPRDKKRKKGRFYDGLTFFRAVPGFMIQGGDPLGDMTGGPGYSFEDEFHPELRYDRPGLFAMANSGPDTNGSQFFITDDPRKGGRYPVHLQGKHAIFGEVVLGLEAVSAIADAPAKDEILEQPVPMTVEIVRVEGKKG